MHRLSKSEMSKSKTSPLISVCRLKTNICWKYNMTVPQKTVFNNFLSLSMYQLLKTIRLCYNIMFKSFFHTFVSIFEWEASLEFHFVFLFDCSELIYLIHYVIECYIYGHYIFTLFFKWKTRSCRIWLSAFHYLLSIMLTSKLLSR